MPQLAPPCPCGIGQNYPDHCEIIHQQGAGLGVSAESLMRARYSAYVLELADFLLESWHKDMRPDTIGFDSTVEWVGLEIVDTTAGGAFDIYGTVEFRARFRRGTENLELHETSSFVRVEGNWVYVVGE